MQIEKYFQSLTLELKATKDRVRNFLDDRHWLTDGEWKESVLRTVLKRHLPNNLSIGRGFVITKNGASKQIDILIYDSTIPILYKDGDLVFITLDAVRAVIEVKSTINRHNLKRSISQLADNADFINNGSSYYQKRFYGLFSYETDLNEYEVDYLLRILYKVVQQKDSRLISYISLGESLFIRYWEFFPNNDNRQAHRWHAYLLSQKAPAYFINNIIGHLCPNSVDNNIFLWYPMDGNKERNKIGEKRVNIISDDST